jgi:glyoxylase-like metal-dependent hydrolase (beta-lactamase superfamily II)
MIEVFRVLAPNPGPFTLEGTNTWVVGKDRVVVIDPGPEDEEHVKAVAREAGTVAAILVTHGHPDHAPGATLLEKLTGAPVISFPARTRQQRAHEEELIEVDSVRLRAVRTPGHSADHVAFFEERSGALFTGDAVLGRGTTVIAPPDGDLAAYVRSLQRMKDLSPRTIYPGHGPAVFDALGKLDEYLEHRAMREQQVLDAIAEGRDTIDAMVETIYSDYPPELHPAAGQQVRAQLEKLEREGRVKPDGGDRFALVTPSTCERCGRPAPPRSRFCAKCSLDLLQEEPSG